jgi:hypothetical protein
LSARLGWQPEVRFLGDLASGNFTIEPAFGGSARWRGDGSTFILGRVPGQSRS